MGIEFEILDWFQRLRTPVLDALSIFFDRVGAHGELWIVFAVVLLLFPKSRKAGLAMGLSLLLYLLAGDVILKPLLARPRPCDLRPEMLTLVPRPSGWSLPSGHTASAFAAASALFFQKNRLGIAALLLAAFIGLTRLYLYVHFPTDVLAGAVLGVALGAAASALINLGAKRLSKRRLHS